MAKYIGQYQVRVRLLFAIHRCLPTPQSYPTLPAAPNPLGSMCLLSRCRHCLLWLYSLSNPTATTHSQAL